MPAEAGEGDDAAMTEELHDDDGAPDEADVSARECSIATPFPWLREEG